MCMQVLERLADAVEAEVGPVLQDSFADQAGASAFSFLAASVLAEADTALAAALPGACPAAIRLQPALLEMLLRSHSAWHLADIMLNASRE